MKTVLKTVLVLLVLLFVGFGGLFYFVGKPKMAELESNKKIVSEKADAFMNCILKSEIEKCASQYTTDKFKKTLGEQDLKRLSKKLNGVLGDRYIALIDAYSLSIYSMNGPLGASTVLRFTFNVGYKNDLHVREN